MLEKDLERRLVDAIKKMGGLCLKFVSPGNDGMPDRIVLFEGGKVGFVEVKRHGQRPRPLQLYRLSILQDLGLKVYVLDDPAQIENIIKDIQNQKSGKNITEAQNQKPNITEIQGGDAR
ncbi:hypothetical protein FACS1894184_09290 [Clostridia bacterium]|nr:hypothetical protein FACS1894184_09290 [Clostridia bacterium]